MTHAPGLTIEQGTLGVGRAEDVGTWTLTVGSLIWLRTDTDLVIAAEGVTRAVSVPVASLHVETLGRVGGVRDGAGRTATLVAAGQILASSAKSTSCHRGALINVDTADLGVAGVARLALTQVAAGQVGADAVLPTGAGLAALVHIHAAGGDVGRVVGPAGLALAVSLLVLGLAERVLRTLDAHTRLGAGGGGGAAHEGGEAGAGEGARSIDTHGIGAAHQGVGATLVHVKAEGPGSGEALPADALAGLALGVVGAVKVGLAQGPDLGGLTCDVAIAGEPRGTLALVSGVGVPTHSVGCKIFIISVNMGVQMFK